MQEQKLALFDFDGTISTKDTTSHFIKVTVGKRRFNRGRIILIPVLLGYASGFLSHHRAKELFLSHYFRGWPTEKFLQAVRDYHEQHLPGILRSKAIERIQWHQQQKHRIVVVSGSLSLLLEKWCNEHQLELIATGFDVAGETISGQLSTRNCFAGEKAVRIYDAINLNDYSHIYAYGDSSGDKEMLALADEAHYKPFE